MSPEVLYTIISLSALGAIAAIVLYIVAQKFKVYEDPRIDKVEEALPAANCGGCGYPGCRGFAEALVKADDISDYYELCRSAFATAEECKTVLKLQTDAMRCGQEIIKEDLTILNIPIARKMIFKILRKGFEQKVSEFNRVIDLIYEQS